MATNYILPFAQGGGALVQTTTTYTADSQRSLGNQPGVARPDFVNKALRQLSAICAGVGQFIADNQGSDVTDDLLASVISTMLKNACKASAQSPAGTVVWIPGTTPLANTVKINGVLLSRTTYANLYAFANASGNMAASDGAWVSGQFSPGDGSTTFRIPDYRGYHLRAFDDSRGVDTARTIGSVQLDQLLQHTHAVTDPGHGHTVGDPGHAHGVSDPSHSHTFPSGPPQGGSLVNHDTTGADLTITTAAALTGIGIQGAATGITVGVQGSNITIQNSSGGSEVRVKNIAAMPLIYY
jgi:hypothetical protein